MNDVCEVYDYLASHLDEVRCNIQARDYLERFISAKLDTISGPLLLKILNCHDWNSAENCFSEHVVFDNFLEALGTAFLTESAHAAGPLMEKCCVPSILAQLCRSNRRMFANRKMELHCCCLKVHLFCGLDDDNFAAIGSLVDGVVTLLLSHFGDVLLIDADNILCIFPLTQDSEFCVQAILCGIDLTTRYKHSCGAALSVGALTVSLVETHDDGWSYLVHGPCCLDVNRLPIVVGDLVFSVAVQKQLREDPRNDSDFSYHPQFEHDEIILYVLDSYCGVSKRSKDTSFVASRKISGDDIDDTEEEESEMDAFLKLLVPPPVLSCVYSESTGATVQDELRHVTVLRARLYVRRGNDEKAFVEVHTAVQQVLSNSGGYLRRLEQCEGGWSVEIVWGIPLSAYNNNTARSLYCGLALCEFAMSRVAISTGVVVCGLVGSKKRVEYVLVGAPVTTARELIGSGERIQHNLSSELLVDANTYQFLTKDLQKAFVPYGNGIDSSQAVQSNVMICNRPIMLDKILQDFVDSKIDSILPTEILRNISNQLDKITNSLSSVHLSANKRSEEILRGNSSRSTGSSSRSVSVNSISLRGPMVSVVPNVTCISGGAGTGKSSALRYISSKIDRTSGMMTSVLINCKPGDEADPMGLIVKAMTQLVGASHFSNEYQQRREINRILDDSDYCDTVERNEKYDAWHKILRWTSADTVAMSAHTHEVFSEALSVLMKRKRLVLLIDDAQHCDELSWAQLQNLQQGVTFPLAVFFTVRTGLAEDAMKGILVKSFSLGSSHESSSSSDGPVPPNDVNSDSGTIGDYAEGVMAVQVHNLLQNSTFLAIVEHNQCQVLKLRLLNYHDVKVILEKVLVDSTILHQSLVKSVRDMSGGSAYWVTALASFINTHGVDMLRSVVSNDRIDTGIKRVASNDSTADNVETNLLAVNIGTRRDRISPLHALVTSRFDMLNHPKALHIAKYASVIGEYFEVSVLKAILPNDEESVDSVLALLRAENLIVATDTVGSSYAFQNSLIRTNLYDQLSKSSTEGLHLAIAEHLVKHHKKEVTKLSYHYRKAKRRFPALQYTAKSASRCIQHEAFSEGFLYLEATLPLAVSRSELQSLIRMAGTAITRLTELNNKFGSFFRRAPSVNDRMLTKYCKLKTDMESTMSYMTSAPPEREGLLSLRTRNRRVPKMMAAQKMTEDPNKNKRVAQYLMSDDDDEIDSDGDNLSPQDLTAGAGVAFDSCGVHPSITKVCVIS